MNFLQKYLEKELQNKNTLLMTHVVAGYPTLKESKHLLYTMIESGVDLIEIQIPFSDPLADGPTILDANITTLNNGVTLNNIFDMVLEISKTTKIPLLLMGYFNTVFTTGTKEFCKKAKKAGAKGLIIPDIPIDEEKHENFSKTSNDYDLANIRVISPGISEKRLLTNVNQGSGFIYSTAFAGTTGSKNSAIKKTKEFLKFVNKKTTVPKAIGFGIKTPQDVIKIKESAEIVVVGSAVINEFKLKGFKGVKKMIKNLVKACKY